MSKFVTDTMALVLFLEKRKMLQQVKGVFQATLASTNEIWIPAMCLAEVGYLAERGRISIGIPDVTKLVSANQNFHFQELSPEIISVAFQIHDIPELHDRLIAASAQFLKMPLLTNDPAIQNAATVQTFGREKALLSNRKQGFFIPFYTRASSRATPAQSQSP